MSARIDKKGELVNMQAVHADACFRSKSVQEIILQQPDFLTRFAILFFILIGAGFLVATCFIQYSEKIKLQALIVDSNDSLFLKNGKPNLGWITATNRQFYALAVVEKTVADKIKKGQEAILVFPFCPAVDLDTVRAYVGSVSVIPNRNDFAIIVDLPRVLITSNNRQLHFLSGLNANMQVNSDKISLFNYFFNRK